MNAIIDTNIIIDAITAREPFREKSQDIIRSVSKREFRGAITASTITDIYYITNKHFKDRDKAIKEIKKIFFLFDVITVTKEDCIKALETKIKDYEDSLLFICASKWNADFIITRNAPDFSNPAIPAISPEDFLVKLCT
ncbi:MAG: PIN domain-containing protein [Fibromonadaceae bacterium]|jgi:predicted nucleic acid-binding protein|nr:PIN domain-containing protein [Fibromonadaceae bacterium]